MTEEGHKPPPKPLPAGHTEGGPQNLGGIRHRLLQDLPYLRRFALVLAHQRENADRLVEESLRHALSLMHQWKPGTNLRAWLFGILYRHYLANIQAYATAYGEGSKPTEFAARKRAESKAPWQNLERAYFALPHEQRIALLLTSLEGMTYGEVAAVTGAPVSEITSNLASARATLQPIADTLDPKNAPSAD